LPHLSGVPAHTEEVAGQFSRPGERALLHYLSDEDYARCRQGLICQSCLTPFPAPPSLANLQAWKPFLRNWMGMGKRPQDVKADLARERCPTCNSDVRPEMFALMDVGHDYNNERRDD
jgi:hypothetical protein